jgi:hypothetical protein
MVATRVEPVKVFMKPPPLFQSGATWLVDAAAPRCRKIRRPAPGVNPGSQSPTRLPGRAMPMCRFRRAIERRALWAAEGRSSPASETGARGRRPARASLRVELRRRERYLTEGSPRLLHFAEITPRSAELESSTS